MDYPWERGRTKTQNHDVPPCVQWSLQLEGSNTVTFAASCSTYNVDWAAQSPSMLASADSGMCIGTSDPPAFPAAASDQVAERGLACCKALLAACPPTHPTQLLNLLQRFGAVAALSRDAATEEVHFPCPILTLLHSIPGPPPADLKVQVSRLLRSPACRMAAKLKIRLSRFMILQKHSRKCIGAMRWLVGHRHSNNLLALTLASSSLQHEDWVLSGLAV